MPLSASDQRVLGALFDAESSLQASPNICSTKIQSLGFSSEALETLQHREESAIRPINIPEPSKIDIEQAVAALTSLLTEYPDYAPAYNNRAQAVRMLVGDDLYSPTVSSSSLYSDLTRAIKLASPASKDAALSPLQAKTLASAYTHRGTILLKASQPGAVPSSNGQLPWELKELSRGALEKMAENDLRMGAKFGNQIAKNMSVQLNPFAKLCGETVKAALLADIKESMTSSENV